MIRYVLPLFFLTTPVFAQGMQQQLDASVTEVTTIVVNMRAALLQQATRIAELQQQVEKLEADKKAADTSKTH